MNALLELQETDRSPVSLLAVEGSILATFDHRTQDSGNVSWLVETDAGTLFVKSAGQDAEPVPGAPTPYLDHEARVELLRTAIAIAHEVLHPTVARLLNVIESPWGPLLVYHAARGELLHAPADQRGDPRTMYQRFAHAPATVQLPVFDALLDAHVAIEAAGFVAGDLYDGCMIVNPETALLTLIDLDTYRRGPGTNDMGRMFGSERFMAPEEHELGAVIDSRTTVFTLGRLIAHFGTRLSEDLDQMTGGAALAGVIRRATAPARSSRYASVADLARDWRAAR